MPAKLSTSQISQLEHKSRPGCSDHNTLPTASSTQFLMNHARRSSFGLWDDPLDDLHGPEHLMGKSSMDQVAQLVHSAPPGFQVQPPLQLSLSQLLSLGSNMLGWQVLVQGAEGSFIGYLCWLLDHCSRLGLEQASQPESGVRRVGVLLLSYCHVSSVTILARRANQPRPHPAAKSGVVEERHGRSLLMKKLVNPHLMDIKRQSDSDEDGEGRDGDEDEIPPLPPPALWLRRPSSWTVIDALDESYIEALSVISQERRVGLSAVGHKLGRWGTLAWLAVATPLTVYLFDAATLGLLPLLLGTSENKGVSGRLRPCDDGRNDPSVDDYKERDVTDVSIGGHLLEPLCSNCSTSAGCRGEDLGSSRQCLCGADSDKPQQSTYLNGAQATDAGNHSSGRDSGSMLVLPCTDEDSLEPSSRSQLCEQASERERHGDEGPQHRCLKEVLEDPHLEVVVHDSRNLQDLLQHQAGFTINALFDTQAAEVYLYITLHEGDCPAFVPSLSCLLQRRLHLAPQHLLYERVQRRLAGDSSAYMERPLDEETLQGIASSAAFLCELRALQLRDVLADLRQLTALHCTSHALKDDLMRSRVEQHVVPAAVQRLGRQTVLDYRDSVSSLRRRN